MAVILVAVVVSLHRAVLEDCGFNNKNNHKTKPVFMKRQELFTLFSIIREKGWGWRAIHFTVYVCNE